MDFLQNFLKKTSIESRLTAAGMRPPASGDAAVLFQEVARAMLVSGISAEREVTAFWVPGRIELLGKHTDYAGGSSLLAASARGFAVIALPEASTDITLLDAGRGVGCTFNSKGEVSGDMPPWALYPQTAIRRVCANFNVFETGGVIGFSSNLPRAAGMSSSSALIIATYLALTSFAPVASHAGFKQAIKGKTDLADYLGHIENGKTYKQLTGDGGVGTLGGSQDHTAIVCSKARHVLHAAFQPTRVISYIPLPDNMTLCVGVSGVRAKKTGEAKANYNAASKRVAAILLWWNDTYGREANTLSDIIHDPAFDLDDTTLALAAHAQPLADRFFQFVHETTRYIPGALDALVQNDMALLGEHVDGSLTDAATRLGNQVLETIALARLARQEGAVAASAFGAGYGGSVWALVHRSSAAAFLMRWEAAYKHAFPEKEQTSFFIDETGPAAFRLVST